MHMVAHQMARLVGVRVHVFEEGYIRPNWLTLERDGVNGNSACRAIPPRSWPPQGAPPPALPPIGASLGRRVRNTWDYFRHMVWGAPFYPFYQSHRPARSSWKASAGSSPS
jgi:capsular polysaccharide export protein